MKTEAPSTKSILVAGLVILVSRIPFLFNGYGSEEDAWGLILTAEHIRQTGIYEVSRMPGHPVQELMLSRICMLPSWLLNFLTALVSTSGVIFIMLSLRRWGIRNFISAGIILAFTPVFFINSTNIMDYTWALSLVMLSMYFLSRKIVVGAALALGLACGFRITAGAMVVPFAILMFLQHFRKRDIVIFCAVTVFTAAICFLPAINIYGTSFFTYYEYFPYPPLLKNFYKGTVGAWGIFGAAAILLAIPVLIKNLRHLAPAEKQQLTPLLWMSVTAVLLYTISFLKIPQKSAFVIPAIPFVAIPVVTLAGKRIQYLVVASLIFSCFFLGINLDNPLRGNIGSSLTFRTEIGNAPVAIDPLVGLVTADHLKREQKMQYARAITNRLGSISRKTLIIAGWWQNELVYFSKQQPNPKVTYVYYENEHTLRKFTSEGYEIYYLPEQDFYNDLRFNGNFTNSFAKPFPVGDF